MQGPYSRSPLSHAPIRHIRPRQALETSGKRSRTTRLAHSLHVLGDGARELEHRAAAEDLADRLHVAPVVEFVLLDVRPDRLDRSRARHLLLARDGREVRGARGLLAM